MSNYKHHFKEGEHAIWLKPERGERLPVVVKELGSVIGVLAKIAGHDVLVYVDPRRLEKAGQS